MYAVDFATVTARPFAAVRFHALIPDVGAGLGEAIGTVATYLGRHGITPKGPAVARYVPAGDGGFDIEAGFLVDAPIEGDGTVVPCELAAGEVAHTVHRGRYEDLPQAYAALHVHAAASGYTVDDGAAMWEEYWSGPDVPLEEARTEIYWPLVAA